MDLIFPREYMRAALMVSLLSVWVLVGLFYYLNRYTKREYFTVWTAAWLFYALWLTLSLQMQNTPPGSMLFKLKQWCVAISAVFLLWGSLRFLSLPVRQTLFGLFMVFLLVWTFVSPQILLPSSIGNSIAGVHPAWFRQCFCRGLFLPAAEENAVCGRGHAGAGIFAVGILPGKLSAFAAIRTPFQRRFFCGRGVAALHRRQHDCARPGGGPVQKRADAGRNRGGPFGEGGLAGQSPHHRGTMPQPL